MATERSTREAYRPGEQAELELCAFLAWAPVGGPGQPDCRNLSHSMCADNKDWAKPVDKSEVEEVRRCL